MTTARTKPTGDGERRQMYFDAIEAEDAINEKSARGDIQDIVSISSDEEEEEEVEIEVAVKKGGEKKKEKEGKVLTKSYKTETPLPPRSSRKNQANVFLEKLSTSLDPETQRQRGEERTAANMQMLMLQNMQQQLIATQNSLSTAQNERNELQRRLDRAETELKMRQLISGGSPSSRSRHYSRRRRRRQDSQSPATPSYRRRQRSRSRSRSRSPDILPPYSSRYSSRRSHSYHRASRSPSPYPRKNRSSHHSTNQHSRSDSPHDSANQSVPAYFSPMTASTADPTITSSQPFKPPIRPDTPVIASSSRVTLDELATLAMQLPALDPGDTLSIRPNEQGYYDLELSPSKRKGKGRE